ncbi:uncharacterized protein LOC125779695 [Bactrocera dorsalis]|uniref:Uncharacterized protein LOC125779695 n=1 Tax=Bactrocera dorsalis TaxID=27457 RepID=A0ABM3K647_BACDO|nr:uncharacterized protein LOC125779695 [Bactrocera dorsalis]
MVVLKVLPSDARSDGPQAAVGAVDVTKGTDGQTTVKIDATDGADGQMTVEVDPNLSDVASVGGGSSIGDSVFSLEQLFEEVRADHDLGAEIAHAKAASANLLLRLEQDGADIVLIQEPWLTDNGISGLRTKSHRLLMAKDAGRNRACMLVRNELTVFLLPNFSSADIVTAKLECDTGDFWLISAYMPHDDVVEPPPLLLRRTLAEASKIGTGVIIGSDATSRHQIWGNSDSNSRGESLFDFIIGEDLRICNRGNTPTFVTAGREEVLNLTLTSQAIAPLISNWRVLDDHSFSDLKYIEFSLIGEGLLRKSFRNPWNTDLEGYRRRL